MNAVPITVWLLLGIVAVLLGVMVGMALFDAIDVDDSDDTFDPNDYVTPNYPRRLK